MARMTRGTELTGYRKPTADEKRRGAEVVFMIAWHKDVEPETVQKIDHMRAAIEARHERGRDRIAGMNRDDILAGFSFGGEDSSDLRQPAAPVLVGRHIVYIADEEKGDLDLAFRCVKRRCEHVCSENKEADHGGKRIRHKRERSSFK